MTDIGLGATRDRPVRRQADRVVPDQHGAWGFLALPVLLGVAAGGAGWAQLPVAAAWVAAYPLGWALSGRLTAAHRPERFTQAAQVWASIALPVTALSLDLRPWLLWVGLAFLASYAVNLAYARARKERSLANDLVLVAECVAVVPVIAAVPATDGTWAVPWDAMATGPVAIAALLCAATLIGSTLHVKSLIRARNDRRFRVAAQLFALVAVPLIVLAALAAGVTAWVGLPFAVLALRTLPPRLRTWRPARIGMVELGCFVLVAATGFATLR